MATALWIALGLAFIASSAYAVVRIVCEWRGVEVPARPSFDEHARTALAALQPDDPTLPDLPRLDFIEQIELYLALHAPKES